MCVEDLMVGYYESDEDVLADPDFIAWCERSGRRPTNSWPAYIQALADSRELIELAPAEVLALSGANTAGAAGGDESDRSGSWMEAA